MLTTVPYFRRSGETQSRVQNIAGSMKFRRQPEDCAFRCSGKPMRARSAAQRWNEKRRVVRDEAGGKTKVAFKIAARS
jgi:hypothetical protein